MTNPARTLLSDIQKLAPEITARAAEIENARRLPVDLLESLKSIGVFRIFMPRSHGGLELDLPEALKIISALSRIDGSVGWTAGVGGGSSLLAPTLPRESYDRLYQHGPIIFASSATPAGTAEAVAGGWRVNGRWPFATGCLHADWIVGFCVMTEGGKPLPGPSGPPLMRVVILPARDWQIEDTWHAAGLKGTGSHHVSLRDTFVTADNLFEFPAPPCVPGPLYQAPQHFLPLIHGAICTGIAEAALQDLIELANTGRQQLRAPAPLRDSELFQAELGRISADMRAAQAFFDAQVASHWRHALAGTLKDDAVLTQGIQSAIWIAATCIRVADGCFTLAGGVSLYESSPLQRRMRDLHVAAQHAAAQPRNYVGAGKQLLGDTTAKPQVVAMKADSRPSDRKRIAGD